MLLYKIRLLFYLKNVCEFVSFQGMTIHFLNGTVCYSTYRWGLKNKKNKTKQKQKTKQKTKQNKTKNLVLPFKSGWSVGTFFGGVSGDKNDLKKTQKFRKNLMFFAEMFLKIYSDIFSKKFQPKF